MARTIAQRRAALKRGSVLSTSGRVNKRGRITTRKFGVPRVVTSNQAGFPQMLRTKLRYASQHQMLYSGPSATATTLQFVCNGLFDPQFALGGHQPMYFDQYMAVYNHYTVRASSIKVSFNQSFVSGAGTPNVTVGLITDDDGTLLSSNIITLMEQSGGKNMLLAPDDGSQILRLGWKAQNKFGVTDAALMANPLLRGDAASNPEETTNFVIYYSVNDNTTKTVEVNVELLYDVIFSERKQALQS